MIRLLIAFATIMTCFQSRDLRNIIAFYAMSDDVFDLSQLAKVISLSADVKVDLSLLGRSEDNS